uniref:UBC core domain-containing protein n=1 Tax=Timema douglasi TaxID=61478 RepID=A0A7R8ZCW1_TIMDO|nr:unnamed protein product [Timema douglasi]
MSANVSPSKKALLLKSKPSLDATRWQPSGNRLSLLFFLRDGSALLYLSSLWATALVSRPGRKRRCEVGHATRHKVKEGFGNQINLCRDQGLNPGPPAQESDTLPLDHQVTFIGTNIPVHPHVYSNGHICLSILTEDWSPALSVQSVCLSIVSMLSSCKEKKRPPDNSFYVKTCNKNPKKTKWWYHGMLY